MSGSNTNSFQTNSTIAIIDYGGGNTGSLYAALRRLTPSVVLTSDPAVLRNAAAAVLPGDGAFSATMMALRERGLLPEIERFLETGRPFLGICVGMQILFDGSDEFGETRGLGFFSGRISRFRDVKRIPNIGWCQLKAIGISPTPPPILEGLSEQEYAYFMHSYRADVSVDTIAAASPSTARPLDAPFGMTRGETVFSAITAKGNVIGMQFHPEKSQSTGAKLLQNFVRMSAGKERV